MNIGNINNLSFFGLTNNVVRVAKTDINLFDMMSEPTNDISHLINKIEPDRTPPVFKAAGPPPTPDGSYTPSPQLTDLLQTSREDNMNRFVSERDAFYAESKPVQNVPNPTPVGFNIVDDNLVMILTGNSYTGENVLNNMFNVGHDFEIIEPPNSVLGFEARINNLKNLYEYLGDTAIEHKNMFDFAVQDIIDGFLHRGGMYVNADKEGVADSIRAMFDGSDGKYSLDDLKTMAVLSFERLSFPGGEGRSEFQVGADFGYHALQIEMARNAGKLSDAAYETVKDAFDKSVEDYITQLNKYQESAKADAFSPKHVNYSPVRPELVYKSIDIMLGALEKDDFNQGFREALKTLEDMHTTQRDISLMGNGKAEARFSMTFAGNSERERTRTVDALQISSRYFTEYINRPEWQLNGNPFSISVAV